MFPTEIARHWGTIPKIDQITGRWLSPCVVPQSIVVDLSDGVAMDTNLRLKNEHFRVKTIQILDVFEGITGDVEGGGEK